MAVLVTRPAPDNAKTAKALQARGYAALLSPVLEFEPLPFQERANEAYEGVVLTSANAARALAAHPIRPKLLALPVFAVGDHTADAARDTGFQNVISADGDASALRDVISARAKKAATLCYIAGADVSRDLAGELAPSGFLVVEYKAYRMIPADLSDEASDAFRMGRVDAILHFSARSARAFLDAARGAGVEISALALPHGCISDAVAATIRERGATQVTVARAPREDAVLDTLKVLNVSPQ